MAVGIEERMVPHMENKKQDCKKIEELKRQYAGSEMSGEQVEHLLRLLVNICKIAVKCTLNQHCGVNNVPMLL